MAIKNWHIGKIVLCWVVGLLMMWFIVVFVVLEGGSPKIHRRNLLQPHLRNYSPRIAYILVRHDMEMAQWERTNGSTVITINRFFHLSFGCVLRLIPSQMPLPVLT